MYIIKFEYHIQGISWILLYWDIFLNHIISSLKFQYRPALLVIVYIHTYLREVVYLFSQPDDS